MKLIDKDAVVTEIERLQSCTMDEQMNFYSEAAEGEYHVLSNLESFIDTLEVKEVDLEKEIKKYIQDNICGYCVPGVEETAKHFFELGLKAKKRE